jgi:hypothetical protein
VLPTGSDDGALVSRTTVAAEALHRHISRAVVVFGAQRQFARDRTDLVGSSRHRVERRHRWS